MRINQDGQKKKPRGVCLEMECAQFRHVMSSRSAFLAERGEGDPNQGFTPPVSQRQIFEPFVFVCYGKKLQPLRNGTVRDLPIPIPIAVLCTVPFPALSTSIPVRSLPPSCYRDTKTQPQTPERARCVVHFNLNLDCFRPLNEEVVIVKWHSIEHKEPSSSSS